MPTKAVFLTFFVAYS